MLTNPTNGSSYWLTQVQTQQVASNQLRAIENDRWVLQVAPTGFSAIIDPDGNVRQRTGLSERAVLQEPSRCATGEPWPAESAIGPSWPMASWPSASASAPVTSDLAARPNQ